MAIDISNANAAKKKDDKKSLQDLRTSLRPRNRQQTVQSPGGGFAGRRGGGQPSGGGTGGGFTSEDQLPWFDTVAGQGDIHHTLPGGRRDYQDLTADFERLTGEGSIENLIRQELASRTEPEPPAPGAGPGGLGGVPGTTSYPGASQPSYPGAGPGQPGGVGTVGEGGGSPYDQWWVEGSNIQNMMREDIRREQGAYPGAGLNQPSGVGAVGAALNLPGLPGQAGPGKTYVPGEHTYLAGDNRNLDIGLDRIAASWYNYLLNKYYEDQQTGGGWYDGGGGGYPWGYGGGGGGARSDPYWWLNMVRWNI